MSLLDQLKSPEDGVRAAGSGVPTWRPARERSHPEGIEGTIVEVGLVPIREPREGGPTEDHLVVIETTEGDKWRVYGSVRTLRDAFDALMHEGKLVVGTPIAIRFFGSQKATGKDGGSYSYHSYAVLTA